MFHNRTPLQKLLLLKAFSSGGQSFVERTATGNPLTFGTDVSKPLKSLLIPFTPKQEGTGDPSPQNIRSILPWNGLTVYGGGKNLLDKANVINGNFSSSGSNTVISKNDNSRMVWMPCQPNTTYTCSKMTGGQRFSAYCSEEEPETGVVVYSAMSSTGNTSVRKVVTSSNAKYLCLFVWLSTADTEITAQEMIDSVMVEVGDVTPSAYEPYHQITDTDIVFPSAVYGGTLDVVSGVLTVDKAYQLLNDADKWTQLTAGQTVDFSYEQDFERKLYDGSLTGLTCSAFLAVVNQNVAFCRWRGATNLKFGIKNGNSMATPLTLEDVKQMATNGEIAICYDIEPQTVQLTGKQITAIIGNNTIWSDADGIMTAVYLVSSKYAEEHPVGGLGSGLGSGLLGSGTGDNPDEPTEPDEPIEEPVGDGQEEGDTE